MVRAPGNRWAITGLLAGPCRACADLGASVEGEPPADRKPAGQLPLEQHPQPLTRQRMKRMGDSDERFRNLTRRAAWAASRCY